MTNPNPNQPIYPYGGGTDNPSEDTSYTNPGGPSNVAAVETGAPPTAVLHPPIVAGISQAGTDTILTGDLEAVPLSSDALGTSAVDVGADPEGGVDPLTGDPREAGQDEVAGATETTSGLAPSAFPEPSP